MAEGETKARKPRKGKKMAKKVPKKVSKKSKADDEGDSKVKLSDLASEAKITAAAARRKLRDADLSREGRWAWDEGSKDLKAARKALGLS